MKLTLTEFVILNNAQWLGVEKSHLVFAAGKLFKHNYVDDYILNHTVDELVRKGYLTNDDSFYSISIKGIITYNEDYKEMQSLMQICEPKKESIRF